MKVAAALAGGGEFGGVGEGFAEVGGGVGDLDAGAVDLSECLGFADFETGEAVFQAGDQADGVHFG